MTKAFPNIFWGGGVGGLLSTLATLHSIHGEHQQTMRALLPLHLHLLLLLLFFLVVLPTSVQSWCPKWLLLQYRDCNRELVAMQEESGPASTRVSAPTNIGIAMGTVSVATIVVVRAGVDI